MSSEAMNPTPSLAQIRRDLRWRRLCPGLLGIAALFGAPVPMIVSPYDLDAMWVEYLRSRLTDS